MAPMKLQLRCPICNALHKMPRLGARVVVPDIQCRYACHSIIEGFAYYNGLKEQIVIRRHEVVRDLRWLSSASFDKTEE